MRITYDPENIAGAERYLIKEDVVSAEEVRDWLEGNTNRVLGIEDTQRTKFGVVWRGLGFFWDRVDLTNAPAFKKSTSDVDESDGAIEVTYWLAADTFK